MAAGSLLSRFFPAPDDIITGYLGKGERKIYEDRPSLRAFLALSVKELIVALALLAFFMWWLATNGDVSVGVVVFLAFDALVIWLVLRRLGDFYTRYVITNFRIMRVSGILNRSSASIPWSKITDLSFKQSVLGRFLGYATIRIESANEESGLKDLSALRDPVTFNRVLLDYVIAKQGLVRPTWADNEAPGAAPAGTVPALSAADGIAADLDD